eukprot:CAMPEP_0115008956 /NCGR_PEP_ID=MMETSP0216-20121206/22280_1 /TAXON_ID=223996 /ORGANISM="Protocruzia adherens, Strain Boccale" /LENGTH=1074 /DNA_ID=CAMNT_0002376581 /DNA_START=166 /DNA_END=3390 /DNA_ORIENTATION=-
MNTQDNEDREDFPILASGGYKTNYGTTNDPALIQGNSEESGWKKSRKCLILVAVIMGLLVFGLGIAYVVHQNSKKGNDGNNSSGANTNDDGIETSAADSRPHRYFELDNGMKAFVVQATDSNTAGVSVAIDSGSFGNPDELPGLAHFLEHAVFISSAAYPEEDEFMTYISQNGGTVNAFTTPDRTQFYFGIPKAGLQRALDIFAHMFIDPTLAAEAVARESSAVNSEYLIDKPQDGWRQFGAFRASANPKHPFSRFDIGNTETLKTIPAEKNIDMHEALKNFLETHYFGKNMSISMVSPHTLDEMEEMIKPLFSRIRSQSKNEAEALSPAYLKEPLFTKEQLGRLVQFESLSGTRSLSVNFAMPSIYSMIEKNPLMYLTNILEYSGEGSLYQALSKKGYISGLSAGEELMRTGSLVSIDLELTKKGYDNYNECLRDVFVYIKLLQSSEELPPQLVSDIKDISSVNFSYSGIPDASEEVQILAEHLLRYSKNRVFLGAGRVEDYDPKLTHQFSQKMTLDNSLVLLNAPEIKVEGSEGTQNQRLRKSSFLEQTEGEVVKEVPYLDFNISSSPISQNFYDDVAATSPHSLSMSLPAKNQAIPQSFEMVSTDGDGKDDRNAIPQVLIDSDTLKLHHKLQRSYGLPMVRMEMILKSTVGNKSINESYLLKVYQQHIINKLVTSLADEVMLNVASGVETVDAKGLHVSFGFFSDKFEGGLQKVLSTIDTSDVSQAEFELARDKVENSLRQLTSQEPVTWASWYATRMLAENRWTPSEMMEVAPTTTRKDLTSFIQAFKQKNEVKLMMIGNTTSQQAESVANLVKDRLNLAVISPEESMKSRVAVLPEKKVFIMRQESPYKVSQNGATLNLYQYDVTTPVAKAKTQLLSKLMGMEFFQTLRTGEQLGYVTFLSADRTSNVEHISAVVNGDKLTPDQMDVRMENFLTTYMKDHLASMTEQEFNDTKLNVISSIKAEPTSLGDESNSFWSMIQQHDDASYKNQIADEILKLQLTDIQQFANSVYRQNMKKLSVQLYSSATSDQINQEVPEYLDDATLQGYEVQFVDMHYFENATRRYIADTAF